MFREKRSIVRRLTEAISPPPVRDRITRALHKLSVQLHRIEKTTAQLEARDRALYEKCVAAMKNNQTEIAKMYADECNTVRKIAKVALNSQFAVEKVVLRLDAIKEFGNIAHMMTPLRSVIGSVRSSLSHAMPDISLQLGEVDESLQEIVADIGGVTEQAQPSSTLTEEAQKIFQEAATLAEQQVKDRFPELPTVQSTESNIRPATGPS